MAKNISPYCVGSFLWVTAYPINPGLLLAAAPAVFEIGAGKADLKVLALMKRADMVAQYIFCIHGDVTDDVGTGGVRALPYCAVGIYCERPLTT